ncbi:hypothetical protein FQA47_024014 [Oryzias melastigma]|uniref:Uncharacterized protein n=1 Tax=Oryzias melastigma TaxID=30732 RepID=A0A834L3C5_ORYME|nr:hypothetical protein FQA47_024014 [Oryzias melastigma]
MRSLKHPAPSAAAAESLGPALLLLAKHHVCSPPKQFPQRACALHGQMSAELLHPLCLCGPSLTARSSAPVVADHGSLVTNHIHPFGLHKNVAGHLPLVSFY